MKVGESVAVTLSLQTACGESPANVVLVIDSSATGQTSENILTWADDLIEFAQSLTPLVHVGVVDFNDVATARCELMRDPAPLHACIAGIVTGGTSHPNLGLREAQEMLYRGRSPDPELATVTRELVILLMGSPPVPDCTATLDAAAEFKARRMLVTTICGRPECDSSCARRAATNPRYYFAHDNWEGFRERFRELMVPFRPYRTLITTTLSPFVALATVYSPAPSVEGRNLTWELEPPTSDAITVTYRAYALAAGNYAVYQGAGARVEYRGGMSSFRRDLEFEPATIDVTGSIWFPLLQQRW